MRLCLLFLSLLPLFCHGAHCFIRHPPNVSEAKAQPAGSMAGNDACKGPTATCIYFRHHSTRCSRSFAIQGCMEWGQLPVQCRNGGFHYAPFFTLKYNGQTYNGSLKCCSNDYCNEMEEAVYVPVRYRVDPPGPFKKYAAMPILMLILVAIVLHPIVVKVLPGKRREGSVVEPSFALPVDPHKLGILSDENQIAGNIAGYFTSLQKMHEVIKKIEGETTEGRQGGDNAMESEKCHEKKAKKETKKKGHSVEELGECKMKTRAVAYQASHHVTTRYSRTHTTKLTDLLARLVEAGPYEMDFDPNELGDLFDHVSHVLSDEKSVIELKGDVYVIGNLEGGYRDLFRWFSICGWPPSSTFLFLGGCINAEEPSSLETLTLLFALKKALPKHIHMIRGEAEGLPLNIGNRGFPTRISTCLQEVAAKALSFLPIAAIINKKILCVHGGIPSKLKSLDAVKYVKRPLAKVDRRSLEGRIFLSFPEDEFDFDFGVDATQTGGATTTAVTAGGEKKTASTALGFISADIDEALERLGMDLMIRAKSPCKTGISFLSPHIYSLWSAPGVLGASAGCALHVDSDLTMTAYRLYAWGELNTDNVELNRIDVNAILEAMQKNPSPVPAKTVTTSKPRTNDKKETKKDK